LNLLNEGINKGLIIKTDRSTKLTVDGISDTYPIYKVKLDLLYFNDQNDRIATWISQYKTENGIENLDRSDVEKYNNIIHEFITQSNPDKLRNTQNNIEFIGQQKYGVVLNDGRIIDGNRRFTCFRNLSKDNPSFNYFETIILDKDFKNSAKQIKMLELQIQIGEESRVDYNPIDRLVGVYNDLVENKLMEIHEYAIITNAQSDNEVDKLVEISKLLVEFLEAINAPKQFYLARDMDLNGPLYELYGMLKKINNDDKKETLKFISFTNFLMQPVGDMTRFIRNLKLSTDSKYLNEFVEKEIKITENVLNKLPEPGKVNKEIINQLRSDCETKELLKQTMDVFTNKVKATEIRNMPVQILLKSGDMLDTIDVNIFMKLNEEQKGEISAQLDRIDGLIANIREALYV